jgi:hypothetical protein
MDFEESSPVLLIPLDLCQERFLLSGVMRYHMKRIELLNILFLRQVLNLRDLLYEGVLQQSQVIQSVCDTSSLDVIYEHISRAVRAHLIRDGVFIDGGVPVLAVSLDALIEAFQGTSSANVLVLEAARYLGAFTLLLRNFLQAIGRPPM